MSNQLAPPANTIFEAAVLACKSSMAAVPNFRFYDKVSTCTSGDKRRYLKVTWDVGTPEENEKNFNLARQIYWENVGPYMYMTVVDNHSFAVAIREVMYEFEADPGY